ncbi:hypothetical protein ACIQ6Y_12810 [Streptomyces sp. NPDC096205]|uniref:hypothetical protein n=1 Tax=Streptomyces sp. NPDC096205 TaxID=3366081 RepID=UPI00381B3654
MSTAPRFARSRRRLRALALALVLLLPGAPSAAAGLTAPAALAVPGEIVEYDVLDTALRPPHRVLPRPVAPPRPDPVRAPRRPPVPAVPAAPLPSYGPDVLRTVVLRC